MDEVIFDDMPTEWILSYCIDKTVSNEENVSRFNSYVQYLLGKSQWKTFEEVENIAKLKLAKAVLINFGLSDCEKCENVLGFDFSNRADYEDVISYYNKIATEDDCNVEDYENYAFLISHFV